MMNIEFNQKRLSRELEQLASYSDEPTVTRIVYTEQDMKARAYVKDLAQAAGLSIREDALGNTFFRLEGTDPNLRPVATGSHIDAIPCSGRYDGTVGVLGGLEALRSFKESDFRPKRSIDIIMFTSEEPTRFGVGCFGSRALVGALQPSDIMELRDEDGCNPDEVRQKMGFEGRLEDVRLSENAYHAFVELHIEQGPLLEEKNVPTGVVTSIAGPLAMHIDINGEGGHAGAVPMLERKDALLAAAEIALAAEKAARASGGVDSVATVGILDVHPRAANSIPSRVFMTLDIRDTNLARRNKMVEDIMQHAKAATDDRNVQMLSKIVNADPPVACDKDIMAVIEASTKILGLSTLRMVSHAYHDTMFMAQICPVGMIFIPCKGGVSHRPDEYTSPKDIERGVHALAYTLAQLAS